MKTCIKEDQYFKANLIVDLWDKVKIDIYRYIIINYYICIYHSRIYTYMIVGTP